MTQSQLNTHIIHMQNLYADLVSDKYVAKLKIGKLCKEAETTMEIVRRYIKTMYKYQPLEDDVTYAYAFTIEVLTEDTVTITINIGAATFTYVGSAVLADILEDLETDILASVTYDFEVTVIDSILYVYSFDTDLTFATATTVSSSNEDIATIEKENIQNTYCEILLDDVNCLTTKQLCGIINHGYDLLESCQCN